MLRVFSATFLWWQVQSRHYTPVSLAEEDSGTLPGVEFRLWFAADTWLTFFSVALLREEVVPYLFILLYLDCVL